MAQHQQQRSSSKRSRLSNDTSDPNHEDTTTTPQSQASSMLDTKLATLSLPNKVNTNIMESKNLMQQSLAEMHKRKLALKKISAQDPDGARPIVKSAKVDKHKHCPITAPKRFQDDTKMKEILGKDEDLRSKYEKDKSELIRQAAGRSAELSKVEHRKLLLNKLQELAIDLANTERVNSEMMQYLLVPAGITDVQLGNAAAMDYINNNVNADAAKSYYFESTATFAAEYAALHNVPVPNQEIPPFTQESNMSEGEADPLKDNQVCKTIITKTKNTLTDLWPLMTTPFWNEYIQAEIHRVVNKDTTIRNASKKQEEANRQVSLNLEDLQTNPDAFVDVLADKVTEKMNVNKQETARKLAARKKSSGGSKKNQNSKPTKNGQSKRNKSKKNSKKDGQQSNSQQQNNANSSDNNNNRASNSNTRGKSQGGRGRGNGRNHQGGRGNGRGRGGRGRN